MCVALSALGWLAFAPAANAQTVYAVETLGDRVVPITGSTAQQPIAVGSNPRMVAITPDGSTAYVTDVVAQGKVYAIDAAQGSIKTAIPVGTAPFDVAVAPDGIRAYVANLESDNVSVIDTTQNVVVGTVDVGDGPWGIAITPDGERVYVANLNADAVSVIDTNTDTVVETILVGDEPRGIAITPDGERAYVTNVNADTVSVVDTRQNAVVGTIPVGERPVGIAITPDGERAYVANHTAGTVSVIDTGSNTVVDTIPVVEGPGGIAISPDGKTAYVNSSALINSPEGATVTLIDLEEGVPKEKVTIGQGAFGAIAGIAMTPNQPPTADLSAPATAYAGVPVTLDASGSADEVGIESYRFDFGDGSSAASKQPTRRHIYSEPGTYQATATVDDGALCDFVPAYLPALEIRPFTGQTAYCNGPSRVSSEPVEVRVEELPRLRLAVSLRRPQSSLRAVRATATCQRLECYARAFGGLKVRRPGAKPKRFRLKPDGRRLGAEMPTNLAPKIPAKARRAARKALEAGGKVRARVRVTAKGLGGQRRVALRRVRIVG